MQYKYKLERLKDGMYRVTNKETGVVTAKSTTRLKAERQIRIMEFMEWRKNHKK